MRLSQTLGMLSTIANATNLPKFTQNCPKSAKICLQISSSRNFEIPPKIEILVFFKKKKDSMCKGGTKACEHRLDFYSKNFSYAYFIV
jgi:hypothetical protein